jgi:hypothetical protein
MTEKPNSRINSKDFRMPPDKKEPAGIRRLCVRPK